MTQLTYRLWLWARCQATCLMAMFTTLENIVSSALEEFTHHLSGQSPIVFFSWQAMATWWLIPVSKWVITPVISGLTLLIPFITGVITHLLTGMSHQVCLMGNHALRPLDRNYCIFIKENMAQQSINGDTYIVLLRNYQQPAIF